MRTIMKLLLASALLGGTANAATYDFSYAGDAGVVSGRFFGTAQGDANIVFVDALLFAAVDGVRGVKLPLLTTASGIYGVDRQAQVTFDGSYLDFAACADINCIDGVLFDPDIIDVGPVVSTGATYGGVRELTSPDRFTLSLVPEPATWGLMLAGFALVGGMARRRQGAVAA